MYIRNFKHNFDLTSEKHSKASQFVYLIGIIDPLSYPSMHTKQVEKHIGNFKWVKKKEKSVW